MLLLLTMVAVTDKHPEGKIMAKKVVVKPPYEKTTEKTIDEAMKEGLKTLVSGEKVEHLSHSVTNF